MNNLSHQAKALWRRHGSTILTCIGGVGTVATAVMAVKATPKAMRLLDEAKTDKGEDLTKTEMIRVAGPVYIPSVLVGLSALTCIFGANVLNKHQQASLMSAYALLDSSYKDYKNKVGELYGTDATTKVREEIAKDKYEDADILPEDDMELFYDEYSGRYFNSTKAQVQRAEYEMNRDLVMRDYVYLNEFYAHLDIEPIEGGDDLGWSRGGNLDHHWQEWIDFGHHKVVMDDGLECTIISLFGEPYLDFADCC